MRGGEELLKLRTPTTMGVRFPGDDARGLQGRYEHSLYRGAAGVGIVLLDLAQVTGDRRYLELCDEVSAGLIESTPHRPPLEPGLHDGHAGLALFYLARARLLAERDSLDRAAALGLRLAQCPPIHTDIISGAAGTGLLLLALYHATRDAAFLDGARRTTEFLEETAVTIGPGLAWPSRDPRQPQAAGGQWSDETDQDPHSGLGHGTAGVCLFLVELAAVGDARARRLSGGGFRWLDATARPAGRGLGWPRSVTKPTIETHWCHGSTGIAHAYLALYRGTKRGKALATAIAGGHATWEGLQRRPGEDPCHCHGLAGAMELFLELAAHGGGPIWRRRAASVLARLGARAKAEPRRDAASGGGAPSSLGGSGAGLALGTAGIVRELLRFAGHAVFPILVPAREALKLAETRRRPTAADRVSAVPVGGRRGGGRQGVAEELPESELGELLPRAAVHVASRDRYVVVGVPDIGATRATMRLLRESPAGAAYFEALDQITQSCRRLEARYDRLLAPGALGPRSQGMLLREVAGLAMQPAIDPRRVRRTARRLTADSMATLELMLSRVAVDSRGALAREVGGRLTEVEVYGGDPHRRGQRVVALRFEDGSPLFYKARSLALDREMAGATAGGETPTLAERCNGWLNPAVRGGRLPTHRLVAAGPWHGYAERILDGDMARLEREIALFTPDAQDGLPRAEVTRLRAEDEQRFWYSAGLLAGHAFTLGLHDLHAENVVCGRSQSTPYTALHAVDLELAFGNVEGLADTLLVEPPRPDVPGNAGGRHSHAAMSASLSLGCGFFFEPWALEATADGVRPLPEGRPATRWIFPHLAQNADGSFGYARHLCVFLRGLADQWTVLRSRAGEVGAHLRASLSGVPARILCKPTQSYQRALEWRKMGGPPHLGRAVTPRIPVALPLIGAELRQLDALDVPYFFRFLGGDEGGRPGAYWMARDGARIARVPELDELPHVRPYWSILEGQTEPERFAHAVADAVRSVAPSGPFQFHDPFLGVRVTRPMEDESIWVVLWLGEPQDERLTCRVAPGGAIAWWLHRRKRSGSDGELDESTRLVSTG